MFHLQGWRAGGHPPFPQTDASGAVGATGVADPSPQRPPAPPPVHWCAIAKITLACLYDFSACFLTVGVMRFNPLWVICSRS